MTEHKYHAYGAHNISNVPQFANLPEEDRFAIDVVSRVLPFKINNYVADELINWDNVPNDPVYTLTVPQRGMLAHHHFEAVARLVRDGAPKDQIDSAVAEIRATLNPHPAGQLEHNVPELYGERLEGMQHKYRETVLFFPASGQTCHAYCTFCFRWPQFVGDKGLKFASAEASALVDYLRYHPEVTNVLFTGGDPMVMSAARLESYIRPILEARLPNIVSIRIGTKSLSYWPYRYLTDKDSEDVLSLFREITGNGLHLAIMAHFNHPQELQTSAVAEAIGKIRDTGAEIRTQSPLMANINDRAEDWSAMWRKQVNLGCIPYYMFIARDTGAQQFFRVPLVRAQEIYREAYAHVSGLARTVRGPSMSADPGKVRVIGPVELPGRKVMALNFLQARDPDWVQRIFLAEWDENAAWLDELRPAFGETRFFFEDELAAMHGNALQELVFSAR
ncbi:MAG TPA: lysine 2,3-aminomutase [Dehalococcoidia bacterium]|nr:lysine 2,3-aminomutase [Dehalococcoidia bacterium]